jgi:hypothetical protein
MLSHTATAAAIATRQEFDSSNLTGRQVSYALRHASTGYLPIHYAEQFRTLLDAFLIDYVVYSYRTPIAWHTVNGQWIIPEAIYSPSTNQHQRIVKGAIAS